MCIGFGYEVVEFGSEENGAVTVGFEVDAHVEVVVGCGVDEFDPGFGDDDVGFDDVLLGVLLRLSRENEH